MQPGRFLLPMEDNHPLLVILGPTASGKTELAVTVAKRIHAAVISADSRQVYRRMDLGTGKDLDSYGDIPYHLIDILEAGERYHVARYREDFHHALNTIQHEGKRAILCGGTGLYIQSVLQGLDYSMVPVNNTLRHSLDPLSKDALTQELGSLTIPADFKPDTSTKKRLIRAIEIADWCSHQPLPPTRYPPVKAILFGIDPPVEERRRKITERLVQRLDEGLIEEVKGLLENGIPPEKLIYYGLEYKYITQYLLGELDYQSLFSRLNTEIHRFAKRQMTYFRKMEKDGFKIRWLSNGTTNDKTNEILNAL